MRRPRLSGLLGLPRRTAGGLASALVSRVAGPGGSYTTRLLVGLVVLLGAVSLTGLFVALTSSMETSGSSVPFLTTMLEWGTNGWGYVLVALIFARSSLWGFRKSLVHLAARKTGYDTGTIERLAAEARTPDGATRVLALSSDSIEELAQNLRWGFDGRNERIKAEIEETEYVDTESWWSRALTVEWPRDDNERALSGPERMKLFRMDLASALNTDDVLWRFAVPALVVFVLEVLVVRVWVVWWLYLVLASVALFVAALGYVTVKWRRHRRLDTLRADATANQWDEVSVLVKKAETDELTIFYGFLAGRVYASDDPDGLARVLAERAHQRANGLQPAPALEERNAWCLKRYLPSLASWRENVEKPAVMDELVETVRRAPDGIIAKDHLVDAVVEHDRRYIWRGLRFVGFGYDPELIAEAYEELVPQALVEETVRVTGGNGDESERTVVRLRTEPLPKNTEQLRAAFSQRFHARDDESRYDLPEFEIQEDADRFVVPERT
ncbi:MULTISPECIES: hypothetical protein [Halorussus]|uniref:hypothetical protein n=1 Tax=Halorussus TaxID=1070314 RepID=UPI0020A1ED6C|nr:hypothetical protein [Halorussus vallis]USZ78646.1 hypothetical protein NGM07_25185 [Halorussus vallis]USZ78677.1 hypothetical protein NGM07_24515 [Halorussus vallis]